MSNKKGSENPKWQGYNISYRSLHQWIVRNKPKPSACESCGMITDILDAANISGKYYRDFNDWRYLCKPCHSRYDWDQKKICRNGLHELTQDNIRRDKNGKYNCIACMRITQKKADAKRAIQKKRIMIDGKYVRVNK